MTDSWCGVQALQPFIDPATAKKVIFINKDNEAAQMPALFPMEKMERCLGGTGTFAYNVNAYSSFCKGLEASESIGTHSYLQHSPDGVSSASEPCIEAQAP